MEKKLKIQLPSVPSYIKVCDENGISLPVSDFSVEELEMIGSEWTVALVNKKKQSKPTI